MFRLFDLLNSISGLKLNFDEDVSKILKEIRRLRRKRKGRLRRTFNEIAEILNEQGHRATNGKAFTGNTVRGIMHRMKKPAR